MWEQILETGKGFKIWSNIPMMQQFKLKAVMSSLKCLMAAGRATGEGTAVQHRREEVVENLFWW